MKIETIPISKLRPSKYNPRQDLQPGDPEYEKLKRSIEEFGYIDPLIWNKHTGNLVGGHQRLKVLIERGDTECEVSVVDLDDAREKALNLALNKISGDWDLAKLPHVLQEIAEELDPLITGFDQDEAEDLLSLIGECDMEAAFASLRGNDEPLAQITFVMTPEIQARVAPAIKKIRKELKPKLSGEILLFLVECHEAND